MRAKVSKKAQAITAWLREKLWAHKEETGLSHTELSRAMGTSPAYSQWFLTDTAHDISLSNFIKVTEYLGLELRLYRKNGRKGDSK